jgi:hypothetical protein
MTKRSSFVMPVCLADVAVVIVDIQSLPMKIDAKFAPLPNLAGLTGGLACKVTSA